MRCLALLYPLLAASSSQGFSEQDVRAQVLTSGHEDQNEVSLLSTNIVVTAGIRTDSSETQPAELNQELQSVDERRSFYFYSLFPLIVVAGVAAWFTRPRLDSPDDMTPLFQNHQYRFLAVWAVAVSADWLQGPYVYALYDSFGYDKSAIDKLFVAGFASSMVFGTFAGSLSDAWGRKRTTLLYCILYAVSCLTKHCSTYSVLMVGRITGGMATSLLFSAFECWMVSESNERHQFSTALLRYMFSMMYFVNYLVAIFAGLVAQALVDAVPMRKFEWSDSLHYGGNICPFDLAIVMLCFAFPMICYSWSENYGCNDPLSKRSPTESFVAAFKALTASRKVMAIGIVVACFEGGMYAFVINWTPTLSIPGAPAPPHGLIFSAMMMCCMTGSSLFSFFNPRINPAIVLVMGCCFAALSLALVSFACGQAASVNMVYMSFLCFEFCVGLYYPAVGALKSELVPEEVRAGIYNWYRVPLNIVVCSVILSDMQLRTAFAVCAALTAIGTVCILPVAISPMPSKLAKAREA